MVKLYYMEHSPPCRAVMMLARALGVVLDLERVDLFNGDHKTQAFLDINFMGTIPVLDDDGFIISESRAILCYLADKYAKDDDTLYPKDLQQRAMVNQGLCFDMGTLCPRYSNYYYPTILAGGEYDESKMEPLEEAFSLLEKFLEASPWMVGDNMTIADISTLPTVNTAEAFGFNVSKYPKISRWVEKCQETIDGYEEIEQEGVNSYKAVVESLATARELKSQD